MAILHANVGTEVGAAVTQHLVTQFDEKYRSRISETEGSVDQDGKTLENYVQLLCQLYAFKVVVVVVLTIQCPLDIATLDLAAALPITTSTPVTNLCHYINSNLVYNDLRIQPLCSK